MLDTPRSIHDVSAAADTLGALIVVVGPSGAGKDSLIRYARAQLASDPAFLFVRRAVTRPADAASEDHDTLSPEAFAAAVAQGQFAVTWEAHGLHYGIPSSAKAHVGAGGVAIANGSRAALPSILASFDQVTIVHVTATPEVLASRLALRGREDAASIAARLRRNLPEPTTCGAWLEIDNSGELAAAGEALLSVIRGFKPR
ncbi:ribose 1,5-bisphosphokinase [Beijerinckia sp. GAS462]|nr:ribose 1,5-bisphosphokinase [Beijerinckia sp. GAS462]SEC72871.1 ribose 1,5-bisphosphokinase [Beijerinckia sp. 28-YEA-48]